MSDRAPAVRNGLVRTCRLLGRRTLGPVSGIRRSRVPGWENRTTTWWQLHRFVDQQAENRRSASLRRCCRHR
ncbi:hypothetical protein UO65_3590 [Actinokineospora spheciospongiae]|uniref:Uncharacterized protein n=1 Tax=Actinokineospora spheciospongiae TaxID=909613 RepID=W7J4T9_9PSEU|nr:hypothetical protein UO65_3590 [Actinokineospora spheciospongiae]